MGRHLRSAKAPSTCHTAFPAQHLWSPGVLSCWPYGLELSSEFYLGSNEQHRLFYTVTYDVHIAHTILLHPVHWGFLMIMCCTNPRTRTHSLAQTFYQVNLGVVSDPSSTWATKEPPRLIKIFMSHKATIGVKALNGTYSTNPNQWPGLILS